MIDVIYNCRVLHPTTGFSMMKSSWRFAIGIYLPALLILLLLALISFYGEIPVGVFTRDAASVKNFHPFLGLLSNLGVLLWCAAATICFLTGFIHGSGPRREWAWFLLASGFLTLILLFDDLFLFHELLAPRYFSLDEKVIYAVYGLITLTYLLSFRRLIYRTSLTLLGLAFFFFAVSIAIDELLQHRVEQLGDWIYLLEDGPKFLGITSWCGYFIHLSLHTLTVSPYFPASAPEH